MNTLNLHLRDGRCAAGFDLTTQHGDNGLCKCPESATVTAGTDWHTFVTALKQAVRDDGTVHACDVRPLVRGRIAPKHIASCYRSARQSGLLVEAGHERSNDERGRNAGRMEPYYELRAVA